MRVCEVCGCILCLRFVLCLFVFFVCLWFVCLWFMCVVSTRELCLYRALRFLNYQSPSLLCLTRLHGLSHFQPIVVESLDQLRNYTQPQSPGALLKAVCFFSFSFFCFILYLFLFVVWFFCWMCTLFFFIVAHLYVRFLSSFFSLLFFSLLLLHFSNCTFRRFVAQISCRSRILVHCQNKLVSQLSCLIAFPAYQVCSIF